MGTPFTTSTPIADLDAAPTGDGDVRLVVIDDRHDRRQLMTYVLEHAGT